MSPGSPQGARTWHAELALGGIAALWGCTFLLIKSALEDISPGVFLALRFALATALLATLHLWLHRGIHGNLRTWAGGIVTGVLLFAGYLLQTLGLRFTTPAKSGFITGLYIVFVPLLTSLLYRRPPGPSEWSGALVATLGLGLMILDTGRWELGRGDLLTLGCAVAFSLHILVLGNYSRKIDSSLLALLQIGTCGFAACLSLPLIEVPFVRWSPAVIAAVLVTSVFATALAFYVQSWGQRHTTATRAAVIFALEPVFAWLTSFVWAGEILTVRAFAGAGCILAGILLVELKPMGGR